jgi:hypothetical protein
MIRIILIAISLFFLLAPLSNAMMHEEKSMKEMMEELQGEKSSSDDMMAPGYGGHMMDSGSGGHMMAPGYGGHMGGKMGHDCGMDSGSGGHMMGSGGHMGGMMGPGMMFDTEEEYLKHLDDTADLRRAMHNKQFDVSEALRDPKTDKNTLIRLKKEMLELKVKMLDRMLK